MALNYLTVQDILWINLQVTKKVQRFNYARLEEASFYQYAYGDSSSLRAQAARFLTGFLRMAPIDGGNEATTFVATVAFLKMNCLEFGLSDDEAPKWFADVASGRSKAVDALTTATKAGHESHDPSGFPNVRATVLEVIAEYPTTVSKLANQQAVAA